LEDRTLPSSYTAATVSDLIADINAANAVGGPNTITLAANKIFNVKAVDNTTDGPTGLPVIAPGDSLTILGSGDTIQRTNGAPPFRLFDVASGASLTLENLTVQNGLETNPGQAAHGGAIYSQGTLVLSGVTVQNNIAQGPDAPKKTGNPFGLQAAGGGIWALGSLTLENGTVIQNNQAVGGNGRDAVYPHPAGDGGGAWGGGLYAGGTLSISDTAISNNKVQGGQGGSGGGNGGLAYGGGASLGGGTVMLANDTVTGNQALAGQGGTFGVGGTAEGGGLYLQGGSMTITKVTVESNTAQGGAGYTSGTAYGGGVCLGTVSVPFTVTFCNVTVENNAAKDGGGAFGYPPSLGGGIYIDPTATAFLDAFTQANTVNNTADNDPNIDGAFALAPNC
jgi:hypothetical protein